MGTGGKGMRHLRREEVQGNAPVSGDCRPSSFDSKEQGESPRFIDLER